MKKNQSDVLDLDAVHHVDSNGGATTAPGKRGTESIGLEGAQITAAGSIIREADLTFTFDQEIALSGIEPYDTLLNGNAFLQGSDGRFYSGQFKREFTKLVERPDGVNLVTQMHWEADALLTEDDYLVFFESQRT